MSSWPRHRPSASRSERTRRFEKISAIEAKLAGSPAAAPDTYPAGLTARELEY